MENTKEHYGLFTATTMIIGIVIGSGIFFKSDDVLLYTGGNVLLGVLVFCIGALSIIFGSLTITELSIRSKKDGGVIGYYEEFISTEAANAFGWFQTLVYYPTINAVISWVAAIYLLSLFHVDETLEAQIIIGFIIFTFIYAINTFSYKMGGHIQNMSTIIKLIPLLLIASVGFFWKGSIPIIPSDVTVITKTTVGFKWLTALAPIAYSFDGWIIATSITNEVKNPKRNMSLALIIGPIVVLSVYLLYFLGLNQMLGAEFIMSTGNAGINMVGTLLFGKNGSSILMIFIIIAIVGVINGVSLGNIRLPQTLASKNMIPHSDKISKLHPKYEVSIPSVWISYVVTLIWMLIHYITQKTGILHGGDVSEIAIVFSYCCYTILYIKVIRMKKQKIIDSFFKGIICPILALAGSSIILCGGIISNPFYVICFIILCSLICSLGYSYSKFTNQKNCQL
ncbi:amino acid/polyamine/organocation transporter (APC superfamily) [Lachnotalea glycerini]|uniref:Amino acid/polyamine/organocation transporter (APC superfamily) n=1 Tax=Lachnotalea glycerini TaxID=1763509 RepID=A0A318ES74_9FIRM|nr:APC family permease [Lachnotalea glycerini]PXV93836.1 amino acid/polyamine/organocation transporter (APC superfamily) [Lachnotalea glycerini]